MRPQSGQHCGEAVGRMGIVDIGLAAAWPWRRPAADDRARPRRCSSAASTVSGALAGGDAQTGGDQGVRRLERAGQRQSHIMSPAPGADRETLAFRGEHATGQGQALPHRSDRHHRMAVEHGRGRESREGVGIGVEHGGRAARQQGFEQPQLGRPVGPHGAMIVEVVLGQIEEAGGGEAHAVEPALVDAMRRGLQRQMGDAAVRQPSEQLGDIGGVGRGQARRSQLFITGANPERSHAGRGVAGGGEDLPAEGGDRGLAIGAGHRDAHARLTTVEGRGGQGIGAARIGDPNHRHAESWHVLAGEDRGRPRRHGLGHEALAVGLRSRQGGEQKSRPHARGCRR